MRIGVGTKNKKMTANNLIYSHPWFAWFPVKCECGNWAWLTWVREEIDETPLIHSGKMPTVRYYKI